MTFNLFNDYFCINGKIMVEDTHVKVVGHMDYSVFNLFVVINSFYDFIGLENP